VKWASGRGRARRAIPYLIAATSGFLLAYLVVALFVFPARIIPNDKRVPNVVGMPVEDAARRLIAAGLRAKTGEERYHQSAPSGTVLSQNPAPGTVEAEGTDVVLNVSLGQRRGEVPPLIGLTRAQAEVALDNAGLDVGEVTEVRDDTPRGQVVSSRPGVGERVPIPSAVALTVSLGPATVQVPDVVGQTYPQARALLEQLGLRIGRVSVDSFSLLPPNSVISQTPAAGRAVVAGTTVSLSVAPGGSP
jgi:beta-lactam-binding protein with PASTA domain